MRALDQYEGLAGGLYVKALQPVIVASAARSSALIYFGANSRPRRRRKPTTSPTCWRRRGIGNLPAARSPGSNPSPPRRASPGPAAPADADAGGQARASAFRHAVRPEVIERQRAGVIADRAYGCAAPPEKLMPARPRM